MISALQYTVFSSPDPLTKTFSVSSEGILLKENPPILIKTASIETAPDLNSLLRQLDALPSTQAVAWGIHTAPTPHVGVTVEADMTSYPNCITRSSKHFAWPRGSVICMIDIDQPHDPAMFYAFIVEAAARAFGRPVLHDVQIAWRPSASAGVHLQTTAASTLPQGGRFYLAVDSSAELIPLVRGIEAGLWATGHGRVEPSRSGQPLYRTLCDTGVWTPDRLDFAASPILKHGVVRDPYPCRSWGEAGIRVKLASHQPLAAVLKEATAARTTAHKDAAPLLEEASARYLEAKLKKYKEKCMAQGFTSDVADAAVEKQREASSAASKHHLLTPNFEIYLDKGCTRFVTIEEIISHPDEYHGTVCCDPLDPEGTWGKAKIYAKQRKIHSFAHGGAVYKLVSTARHELLADSESNTSIIVQLSKVLREHLPEDLFLRGHQPVKINGDGLPTALTENNAQLFFDARIAYTHQNTDRRTGNVTQRVAAFPRQLAKDFVESTCDPIDGQIPLYSVTYVANRPTYMPEQGVVIHDPGYDKYTQTWIGYQSEFPPLTPINDLKKAQEVAAELLRPFVDFNVTPAGPPAKALVLSAILSAAVRTTVVSPAYVVNAARAGTGKTLFCRCIIAGMGEAASPIVWSDKDEEAKKKLASDYLHPKGYVFIDNYNGALRGSMLEQLILSDINAPVLERMLGGNMQISMVNDRLILANGQNISCPTEALSRRHVPIEMDSPEGEVGAWVRADWNFSGAPDEYILANWRERHMLCLSLISGAWTKCLPNVAPPFNAAPVWDHTVRRLVHALYGYDPVEDIVQNVKEKSRAADVATPQGKLFTIGWLFLHSAAALHKQIEADKIALDNPLLPEEASKRLILAKEEKERRAKTGDMVLLPQTALMDADGNSLLIPKFANDDINFKQFTLRRLKEFIKFNVLDPKKELHDTMASVRRLKNAGLYNGIKWHEGDKDSVLQTMRYHVSGAPIEIDSIMATTNNRF